MAIVGAQRVEQGSAAVRALVLGGLWLLYAADTAARLRGPTWLGSPASALVSTHAPVAVPGQGVLCVPATLAKDPRCGRLGASRRLLVGSGLALPTASVADLEALPGIGPRLAARIAVARPLSNVLALARVRGIGPRRAASLAPLLGLDERRLPDICSVGAWPTTSSGCDKLR